MIKFVFHTVIHIVVLAIGIFIGIKISAQNPQAANTINVVGTRDMLQAEAQIRQATLDKLNQYCNNNSGATAQELAKIRDEQQDALNQVQAKLKSAGN
jgi:predicted PurR-regulated permease PerM